MTTNSTLEKAHRLITEGRLSPLAPGTWQVRGDHGTYVTTARTCTCAWTQYHPDGPACAHMLAVIEIINSDNHTQGDTDMGWLKIPPGTTATLRIIGIPTGRYVHWVDNRSVICTTNGCGYCAAQYPRKPRWSVDVEYAGQTATWDYPQVVAAQLAAIYPSPHHLQGQTITVMRVGNTYSVIPGTIATQQPAPAPAAPSQPWPVQPTPQQPAPAPATPSWGTSLPAPQTWQPAPTATAPSITHPPTETALPPGWQPAPAPAPVSATPTPAIAPAVTDVIAALIANPQLLQQLGLAISPSNAPDEDRINAELESADTNDTIPY